MPCKIEIRKVIENSIAEMLPDPDAVMATSAANNIVKELNSLWKSAIARSVSYSGEGRAYVRINSLEDAIEKEFKRQEEAEKTFESDLDFFRGDEALLEQEQREDLFLQRTSLQKTTEETLPSNASPKTLKIIRDFLEKVGVNVNIVKDIVVNGVKYDANGVAQITQQLISVVEGKEAQALPEEAMHFAVAIIKQTNPKLYQKLLKEINGYEMLNSVFRDYGLDPLYQKDGKPDVIKLKEEAIAKVLVERIINQVEEIGDTSEKLKKVQSWWESILDWFKNLLYIKSGFDQITIDIISGKDIGTAEEISEEKDSTFLQKSKQENIYDSIKEISNKITKKLNKEGEERYFIGDQEIKGRVSDIAKTFYDNRKDLLKDDYDRALDELRREKGTAGHADFEHAFSLFVDENGFLRDADIRKYKKDNDQYVSELNNQGFYEILRDNLEKRLQFIDNKNGGGTRFLSEVTIYNGRNLGGTVDFMAISKDGKIDILDWKFMNLNLEYYDDVPWYKIESWNVQMNEYKKILTSNYGVEPKDFGQTRMIPILAEYSRGKRGKTGEVVELPKLTGIKIGDVDVQKISEDEDFLLPVPTKDEISDNKAIDKLLVKLTNAYDRFAKETVTPDKRQAKREQLQSLFKAIRRLQIKRDVRPLIEQADLLMVKFKDFKEKYNKFYKNVENVSTLEESDLDQFVGDLESLEKALYTYTDIHLLLGDIVDGEVRGNLRDIADDARIALNELSEINKDFVNDIIAKREKVEDVLSPEKIVKGLSKWFSSTSTLQIKTIELLYKKAQKAFSKAEFATQDESSKLLDLRDRYMDWAKSKGLSGKNLFSMIKKRDKNELIDQYQKEFYKELTKSIKDGNVKWIKDNVDLPALREEMQKQREKALDYVKNKPRTGTPEKIAKDILRETNEAKTLYSIDSDLSKGWFLRNIVKKFPNKNWETQEWKALNSPENSPAKDFYDYIIERNKEYSEIGYISDQKSRIFLPYVQGSIIEAAIKQETLSLGERFWRSISVDAGDVGYGQIDEETGRPINKVPKYFTSEIEGPISEDLFRTMSLYNEAALRYKYVNEIENQVRAIGRIERNKKSIMTTNLGKVVRDKFGDIRYEPEGTVGNYELFDSMVKAIIYGQRYIENENFDAALVKLSNWGEKINEKIGIKVFPENLEDRQITINKIVDNLNNSFSIATLGLNLGSSVSNLFGGTAQSIINSGKYFDKNDFIAAEFQIFKNKFNGEDKNKFIKALEYFLPLTDNYNREIAKKLSVNVVTEEGFQDFLMSLMRNADRAVQTANFYAFLQNSIVLDGEVLNAREYLRSLPEYKNKYSGSSGDRKNFKDNFEKDVKKLIEEKGVMKLAKIEEGKLVIPGVERSSNSVIEIRRKVQQLTKDALGNLSADDLRTINMTILGKSFMVFKNWIPRLVDTRFGGLKYNSAYDAYEWGRMRTLMSFLYENLFTNFKGMSGLILGNNDGMKLMQDAFEKRAEKYKLETGKDLKMDETMFMDLYQSNLKSSARDMIFLLSLVVFVNSLKLAEPDDDENPAVINQYRYVTRLADKLKDELMYFYDPTSILQLVGSGPFPAVSLINNGFKGIKNFFIEMWGVGTGDDELVEDTKVIKYFMRTFPFTNQVVGYLPMFYPDIAKDLGIRVQSNYGIR